ncbi:CinA family protein [Salinibacterium sp. SYSU T00001]|uniref:CinA family protein n=1 Tax=Homoserinimonas sedimenticola TaxID=2986805 RepID=UPI002235AB3C|nr:CinA family protein [Salinibacterium sedimenticola]MCW4385211.1 CinA family protein [Salinibacterium sedimenticola]
MEDEITALVERIGSAAGGSEVRVACAESLTSGQIASALGAGESSSDWFAGGVVAYHREAKYRALGVERGPVVCETAAAQMAAGVAELMGADIAVSVTGVGGPDEQDGQPVGTVYLGVTTPKRGYVQQHRFHGDPGEILEATKRQALIALAEAVESDD